MFYILISPFLFGFDGTKSDNSPADLVRTAVQNRRSIQSYELSAQVETEQLQKTTGAKTNLLKAISGIRSSARIRIDYKSEDRETHTALKHYTVCRGCVADGMTYYYMDSRSGGVRTACRQDNKKCVLNDMLLDLEICGIVLDHIENLRPSLAPLIDNPIWSSPILGKPPANRPWIVSVVYPRKRSPATLAIHVDPKFDNNVVEMRYDENDGTGAHSYVRSSYDVRADGIFFPKQVEYYSDNPQYLIKEIVRFTKRKFSPTLPASIFAPDKVGLRYNSHVQDITSGAKRVSKFFDGTKLTNYPLKPAEYISDQPVILQNQERGGWSPVYWGGAAGLLVLSLLLFRRALSGRRRL